MKKLAFALLALALTGAFALCAAEDWGAGQEAEMVAATQRQAEAVTTMAEAYALIPEDSLRSDGWMSYAQEYGFAPVALTPEEAYNALRAAYDVDQGAQSYAPLFRGWGFGEESGMSPYLPRYAWPSRRTLCEAVPTVLGEMSVEIIAFDGGGSWQEEGALVFARTWGGEWRLIDYVPGEAESALTCGDDYAKGLLIPFLQRGHGTGYYSEDIALYNPLTRRCEGGYTRIGHDVPRDYGLYVASQVYTDVSGYGVTVVRSTAFATSEQSGAEYTLTQRAQEASVTVYALRDDGSFEQITDAGAQNASPALLAGGDYASIWRLIVP